MRGRILLSDGDGRGARAKRHRPSERLLVHGDVSAPILTRRLSEAVGEITPELVRRIVLRGRGLDFNSSDLGRGAAILAETGNQ